MRWAEHVVQMGDVRRTYKNWDEEKRWEETIERINLKKIRCVVAKCLVCFDVSTVCVSGYSSGMLRCVDWQIATDVSE